jgi:hypothetical protein
LSCPIPFQGLTESFPTAIRAKSKVEMSGSKSVENSSSGCSKPQMRGAKDKDKKRKGENGNFRFQLS